MQVMIFAAGLGTRLKPITDHIPKALVPVAGKTLLQHVIEKISFESRVKPSTIVINVHHFAGMICEFLHDNNNFGQNILISDETNNLLDTGGGIKKAAPLFSSNETILIHNVDIFSNINIEDFYEQGKNNAATLLVSNRKSSRYLYFDQDNNLVGWENTKTGEIKNHSSIPIHDNTSLKRYAFSGIHLFSPKLFKYFNEFPDRFGIIDFYLHICQRENIKCIVKDDLKLLDVGKLDSLQEAENFIS